MELVSKQISVIGHWKDGNLEAITLANGSANLFNITLMSAKDVQEFYEVDKASNDKGN